MLILRIIQIFITWLLLASLVGALTKKLRMPYTVGLVLTGFLLAVITPVIRQRPAVISPEEIRSVLVPNLILALLVPPLVFEAAFHVPWEDLRQSMKPILTLAIPGVALTMLLVGLTVGWIAGIAVPVALVFGALIAATDPVAVVALFRSLGAPKQLLMLLEGESLFNDGTAIVLFHMMLGIVAVGEFRPLASVVNFLLVAGGGLLVGWLSGTAIAYPLKRVHDPLPEVSLSLVAAYGAYLLAEHFHVSGVLAVVAAGLVCGNGTIKGLSAASRNKMIAFWEYAAFLANSFVFLIVGLTIRLELILNNLGYILLAILAVLLARAAVIYGLSRLLNDIPFKFQHVLLWGGLRGAISLALALSLTSEELGANLEAIQAMAFGVVLFTLLVQGTTMASLLKRLNLVHAPRTQ